MTKERVTRAMKVVTAPHDVPLVAYPLGVLFCALGAWRVYHHPATPDTKLHMLADAGWFVAALFCFGLVPFFVKQASGVLALYREFKKPSGGAGPTSGGSSV